jgi:hypothetical protein
MYLVKNAFSLPNKYFQSGLPVNDRSERRALTGILEDSSAEH